MQQPLRQEIDQQHRLPVFPQGKSEQQQHQKFNHERRHKRRQKLQRVAPIHRLRLHGLCRPVNRHDALQGVSLQHVGQKHFAGLRHHQNPVRLRHADIAERMKHLAVFACLPGKVSPDGRSG